MFPQVMSPSLTTPAARAVLPRSFARAARTVLAGCLLFGGYAAHAAEMTQSEFLALVGGAYGAVSPSPEDLFAFQSREPSVHIFERDGELLLKNELFVTTKTFPAYYRITDFECYTHQPTSTTCEFALELLDEGAYVHFLGVRPVAKVNRFGTPLTVTIQPRYSVAGAFEVEPIVLQKRQ